MIFLIKSADIQQYTWKNKFIFIVRLFSSFFQLVLYLTDVTKKD